MSIIKKLKDAWNWHVAEFKKHFDDAMQRHTQSTQNGPKTIDELMKKYEKPNWTEKELVQWLDSFPDSKKMKFVEALNEAVKAGYDKLEYIREIRIRYEQMQTKRAPTLLGILEGIAGLVEYDQDLRYRYSKGSAMENLANKRD